MDAKNRPVWKKRIDQIEVAIWAYDHGQGVYHNATFRRVYKTDQGWGETQSFRVQDLGTISLLAGWAANWMTEQRDQQKESTNGNSGSRPQQNPGNPGQGKAMDNPGSRPNRGNSGNNSRGQSRQQPPDDSTTFDDTHAPPW